jgi:uncharacterized protein (TIGR03435 family)
MLKRAHLKFALYIAVAGTFGAVAWMAIAAPMGIAQGGAAPDAAAGAAKGAAVSATRAVPEKSAAVPAKSAAAGAKSIRFEVASVRRNKAGMGGGNGFTADGYDVKNVSPVILIGIAFNVLEFQRIEGFPEWCKFGNAEYDIDAKVAETDVAEWRKFNQIQIQGALQALLAERFHLKAHFETRDAPAYALVVAKNGAKFKAAMPGDPYPNGEHDGEGKPVPGMRFKFDAGSNHGRLIAHGVPIAQLAQYLSGFLSPTLGRPVLDKTGLAGVYDFTMPILADWGSNHEPEDSEASIFTVLQESLGLKLEPAKAPVEFLVIDHIERPLED